MQAVILAAGMGSRLNHINAGKPKSFLTINQETLIERAIRTFTQHGISDIHLVTGFRHDLMVDKLQKRVTYHHNPLYFCTNVLASFSIALSSINDDFIFLHADTIFEDEILNQLISASGEIVLPIDYKVVQEEEMKVRVDSSLKVLEISKDISPEDADGEFIGLAKLSKSSLVFLQKAVNDELVGKKLLQSYFEGAIQNLIYKGIEISTIDVSKNKWVEIDFPEDYETAVKIFK